MPRLPRELPSSDHGRIVETRQIGSFTLNETRYPAHARIPEHTHEHSAFCFILSGQYEEAFGSTVLSCHPNGLVLCPANVDHADALGREGAHCLIIEPSSEWLRDLADEIALPAGPAFIPGSFRAMANRLHEELHWSDACTGVAVEGLALELAVSVSRTLSRHERRVPAWLQHAHDYLRAHCRDCPELAVVAATVGVHAVHLIRAFRQHYRCTPGQFVRRLRVEAAAIALAQSEQTVLDIALDAGFADQSHFTRAFRQFMGQTPGEYRRAARGR